MKQIAQLTNKLVIHCMYKSKYPHYGTGKWIVL